MQIGINIAVGQKSSFAFDSNAQAFINTAGITNPTEQNAINTLVIGLKNNSLWTKMLAIYPFVGGTSTSCKYNLKNTATFELVFSGTWLPASFTSFGIQPNGVDTYANTNFIPDTQWTSFGNSSASAYSRTNISEAGNLWGTKTASTFTGFYSVLRDGATSICYHNSNNGTLIGPTPTTSAVNLISSRIDAFNQIQGINATNYTNPSNEQALSTFPIYFSAQNNSGVAALFSNRQLAFAHIGLGLTQAECTLFYNIIQTFQTTLGRANL